MRMQVALKVIEGKQTGTLIPLTREKFLIGREEDCQLRPNSDLVSRHHCVIAIDDFTVRIRDLGSTNGTFVNNQRITTQVVLKQGDQIRIGKLAFEIQIQVVTAPKPKAPEAVPEPVAIDYTQGVSTQETTTELVVPPENGQNPMETTTQMYSGDTTVVTVPPVPASPAAAKPPRPVLAPVRLPDPSEFATPVGAPAAAPVAAAAAAGSTGTGSSGNNAADIIRQYMQRRPT
jgi:predicted component of type VI protein secretion system